jgi:hypothetical protein
MSKKRLTNKQRREKKEWDMEMFEREARQRSAWGEYVQTIHTIRLMEEEGEYQRAKFEKNNKKVKEIEEKRKRQTPMIYIG